MRRVVVIFMVEVLGSRFRVLGSKVWVSGTKKVSGVNKVSGVRCQVSAQPLAKKTAGQIEKETS
jgi:hypothetical protein